MKKRGVAVVTGVGRRRSIGAGLAIGLAQDGWDLVLGYWQPYDDRVGLERTPDDPQLIAEECLALGVTVELVPCNLADPDAPELLIRAARALGPVEALVMSHCESVDSSILTTSIESWDRHFAVNARATWLLIKAFAEQLPTGVAPGEVGGHIVALTSDHTAHNLPYGASKGALDRIVIAAAIELLDRGVRSNVINPGPIDTGWMNDEIREWGIQETAARRLGTPQDTANLVRFLLSPEGSWINGQLLYSNGGFRIG
ncbi:MAG: SDR family oxidoreductase [Ancrocorticia sp.]